MEASSQSPTVDAWLGYEKFQLIDRLSEGSDGDSETY